MACQHFGPADPRNSWVLPGPWFIATCTGGECPHCEEIIREGEETRADGKGSYEHRDCVTKKGDQVEFKINVTDEWARAIREIKYEALLNGFEINGSVTITDVRDGTKVTVTL